MFEQIIPKYSFSELEPYIDARTMETHYTKHHAIYTKNFNASVEQAGLADKSIGEIFVYLREIHDRPLRALLKNNGGGFYNHNLFFSTLAPESGSRPTGDLDKQICISFGSFASFQEKITHAAINLFGSGWAWLSANAGGELRISTSPNQDNPIMATADVWSPIMGIDVWEHAYYLQYKNLRAQYVKALFHVIDWNRVETIYALKRA